MGNGAAERWQGRGVHRRDARVLHCEHLWCLVVVVASANAHRRTDILGGALLVGLRPIHTHAALHGAPPAFPLAVPRPESRDPVVAWPVLRSHAKYLLCASHRDAPP